MTESISTSEPSGQNRHFVELRLSTAANRELDKINQPIIVHMELLFSCMIRKQVLFPNMPYHDGFPIDCGDNRVEAVFRAVGTKTCLISDQPVPDLQTFPLKRIEPFMPRWLKLDFKAGHWKGEFGYIDDA